MPRSTDTSTSTKECHLHQRDILTILGFFGMALMYSLRFNLSIAIVAMVDHSHIPSKLTSFDHPNNSQICPELVLSTSSNSSLGQNDSLKNNLEGSPDLFQWDEVDQGLVLGSFFWGYVITQFPSGILAHRYGAKWIICGGLLTAAVLSFMLPWAAMVGGMGCVLVIRFLQGLAEGVMIPAFTVLLSKWTAPDERSSVACMCYSGMPFGTAFTMICSGYLITSFGWPSVFYLPAILTLVWFVFWIRFVYSSPAEHPRISQSERETLEKAIQTGEREHNMTLSGIPWKEIFSSVPFWAIFIAHFTNVWGLNTLTSGGPKYLDSVLHFDIHQNAFVTAAPYLCQWIFCNLVSRFSDWMISRKVLSVSGARRLCNTMGQWGMAGAYLSLILVDCNRTLAVVCFVISGLFNGAVFGGFLINPIDISPNYAGAIEGVINGLSNIAGFGAPYVTGLILQNEPSINGWRYVFLLPVVANFVGNIAFLAFSSTKIQKWNAL